MASFAVYKSNLSLCLRWWLYRQCAADLFWQENDKCLLFTIGWSGQLLFFVLCSYSSQEMLSLQWNDADWGSCPPWSRAFITSSPLNKWRILFHSSPQRSRCCLTIASPRYKIKAAFWLNKFLEKIINLRIIKKSADLGKIRLGPPPKLATCKFASNTLLFSQIHHFFHKSGGFSENSRVLAPKLPLRDGGGGMAWVAILFPSCLGSY